MFFHYVAVTGPERTGGHAGTADVLCGSGCLESRVCIRRRGSGVSDGPALAQSISECAERCRIASRRLQLYRDQATGASGPRPNYWTHNDVHEGQQCCSCRGTTLCSLRSKEYLTVATCVCVLKCIQYGSMEIYGIERQKTALRL